MTNQRQILRHLLASERPLLMPDAFDGLSARLIELAGFKAVQCSGYSMALAACASREAELGLARNRAITRDIVQAVSVPVMADGEDGFGPPSSVGDTVTAFIEAGVAGINLEDQVLPAGKSKAVIPVEAMVEKIGNARRAAEQVQAGDLVINGRTDVLAASIDRATGLAEAIARGNRYLEAGADLVFVTSVATIDEARRLAEGIRGPISIAAGLTYNISTLPILELHECGVARISLPTVAVHSAMRAIKRMLSLVRTTGTLEGLLTENLLCSQEDLEQFFAR